MFEDCEQYTLDPFWKEIIEECNKGRFPKGITFNSQKNTLRTHEGVFDIPLEKQKCTALLLKLFRSCGLKSPADIKIERDAFINESNSTTVVLDCEWKKIKPRSLREGFILDYVCNMGKVLKLTRNEEKRFFKFLNLGIFTRMIDNDDIEYNSGKIHFISNINFNSKTRQFEYIKKQVSAQKVYRQNRKTNLCQKLNKFVKSKK